MRTVGFYFCLKELVFKGRHTLSNSLRENVSATVFLVGNPRFFPKYYFEGQNIFPKLLHDIQLFSTYFGDKMNFTPQFAWCTPACVHSLKHANALHTKRLVLVTCRLVCVDLKETAVLRRRASETLS